jgi:biopolymer transport protein ExbB/TolQ
MSMVAMFQATGFAGPLMLLLGAVALAIAIRRVLEQRSERLAPAALQKSLERAVHGGAADTALVQAMGNRSCLGQLVAAALQLRSAGLDEMLANVERTAARESMRYHNRIANLARAGVVILLVGVLGTVMGLISASQVLSVLKNPSNRDIWPFICTSLFCTAMALVIALFAFVAYFWLDSRMVQRVMQVREMAEEIAHEVAGRAPTP